MCRSSSSSNRRQSANSWWCYTSLICMPCFPQHLLLSTANRRNCTDCQSMSWSCELWQWSAVDGYISSTFKIMLHVHVNSKLPAKNTMKFIQEPMAARTREHSTNIHHQRLNHQRRESSSSAAAAWLYIAAYTQTTIKRCMKFSSHCWILQYFDGTHQSRDCC